MKCPICGSENTLSPREYKLVVHPVPGVDIPVHLEAFSCDHCEQDIETPQTTTQNDLKVAEAKLKWHIEHASRTGDYAQLVKAVRESYDLSQSKLTTLMGTTKNSISKYETGTVSLSGAGERLILLMALHPEAINMLEEVEKVASRRSYVPPAYEVEITPFSAIGCYHNPRMPLTVNKEFNSLRERFEIVMTSQTAIDWSYDNTIPTQEESYNWNSLHLESGTSKRTQARSIH